jgi:hypothetical protein
MCSRRCLWAVVDHLSKWHTSGQTRPFKLKIGEDAEDITAAHPSLTTCAGPGWCCPDVRDAPWPHFENPVSQVLSDLGGGLLPGCLSLANNHRRTTSPSWIESHPCEQPSTSSIRPNPSVDLNRVGCHLHDFGDVGKRNSSAIICFFHGISARCLKITVRLGRLRKKEAPNPPDRLPFVRHLGAASLGTHTCTLKNFGGDTR